jgi:hypothetical protein
MTEREELEPHYYLLAADLTVLSDESYRDDESLAANWIAWTKMHGDPIYRFPWRTIREFRQFQREIRAAVCRSHISLIQRLKLEMKWVQWRWPSLSSPSPGQFFRHAD